MDVEIRKQQARSLEQQGEIAEALVVYRQILTDLEGSSAIWQELPLFVKAGDLSLRLRDAKSAIAMYEQAAKRYAVYGSGKSVIALCSKILRIAPSRSLIYPRLALLMVKRGHISEARAVLANYADLAQLDRTARELEGLSGRSDNEVRPVLEMLIEVSERAEQARLQVAAARREQPQAGSGAASAPAATAPESAIGEGLAQYESTTEGPNGAAESSESATSEAASAESPMGREPEESPSQVGALQVGEEAELAEPAWLQAPEPKGVGSEDHRTATWMQQTKPTEEEEEPPTAGWMREPDESEAQEIEAPVWMRDRESGPEEETQPPAWMQEPGGVAQESGGAVVNHPVADVTGPRKITFGEMQTARRSRRAWVGLAVVVVLGGAALVWFRIVPIGTIGLAVSSTQSEQSVPAAAALADSATGGTETFGEPPAEATTVAALSEAEVEAARAAAAGETIASGDSAVPEPNQPDSGAALPGVPSIVVVAGLPVESVTEISSEGRAGYRVVQRLDTGEPITLILLSLDSDSMDTVDAGVISFESTGDDWTVGSLRFGGYLVNASAGVGADILEGLLRRLMNRPLPS